MNKWLEEIQKSFRSLMLHRTRSVLSTLGILFGVASIVAMLSIGEGAKRETLEQIEQLGMNTIIVRQSDLSDEQHFRAREKRSRGLTLDDVAAIRQSVPEVSLIAPQRVVEGNISGVSREIAPEILSVTNSYQGIKTISLLEGRFISERDVGEKHLVCVLGLSVAKALGPLGHVGQMIRIGDLYFLIIGILRERNWVQQRTPLPMSARNLNNLVFIPLGTEKNLPQKFSIKSDLLSELTLQVVESNQVERALHITKRILEVNHAGVEDYQIIVPDELIAQAYRTQRTFNLVLGSIAAISLLVGGIGIMNIMLANVSERTREIGIRRAVGATRQHIAFQFLMETVLLALTGAVAGILIGISLTIAISFFAGWKTVVTPWAIFLALFMSGGVGIAAGLYPALKAANMDPIAALRKD